MGGELDGELSLGELWGGWIWWVHDNGILEYLVGGLVP